MNNSRLVLSNNGNDYTGDTNITAGMLRSNHANGAIPDGTGKGNVVIGAEGKLELAAANESETINGLSGSGVVDVGVNTGNSTLTVGNNDATSQYDGVIKNTGTGAIAFNLTKIGSGTLTLTGVNTFGASLDTVLRGATTVNAGTLALSGAGAINSPTIDVKSGANFNVSAVSGGPWALAGTQTLIGAGTVQGNVQDSSGAKISGGTVGTAGVLAFSNNLTLNGGGTLQFDLTNDTASGNDKLTVGGNLALGGVTTVAVKSILPAGYATLGTYTLMTYTGSLTGNDTNLFLQDLSAGVGSTRQTLSLSTAVLHQVNLVVTGAPLNLTWKGDGSANAWDLVGASNWNNNTQKFYNADNVTFDSVGASNSTVNLTSSDLAPNSITVNNSTQDYTFTSYGAIVGATGLTKNGSRKLIIDNSGTNTFSGPIAINDNGTLEVGTGGYSGNLGSGAVALAVNATLAYNRVDEHTLSNVLSGTGTLEQKGTGTLIVSGASPAFTGPVKVSTGILKLAANLGTGTGLADITNKAVLQLGGTTNWTLQRRISDIGSVDKIDANTVTLITDNNYSGTIRISNGTLSVGDGGTAGSLGGTGDITLGDQYGATNGTLLYNRQGTNAIARNIVGYGAVQYAAATNNAALRNAVFNVSGNNAYNGNTTVNQGTVLLSSSTGLGDAIGKTTIAGGTTSFAKVELTGGINVAEEFDLQGRAVSGTDMPGFVPHLVSSGGSNTLSGKINFSGSSASCTISSTGTNLGDLLTVSGNINVSTAQNKVLYLRGSGKGEITGQIGGDYPSNLRAIYLSDGGTWSFTNASNYYTGQTQINGSTLELKDANAVYASSTLALADSSAVLKINVPATSNTLTLPYSQSLVGNGTVQGSVTTSGIGNVISPSSAKVTNNDPFNLPGGTMTITGNLSLAGGGETLQFKLANSTTDAKNDKISVGGAVNMTGSSPVSVSIIPDTVLTVGNTYTVLSSTIAWTGANTFQWDSLNNKTRYTFATDTSTPKTLKVTVVGDNHATLTWTGTSSAVWDVIASANWTGSSDSLYWQADAVNFDNTSTVLNVTVGDTTNTDIAPASITVNNDADHNYTLGGAGRIIGGTGITKSGNGTLTIENTGGNSYNGVVSITGGKVILGNSKALGSLAGGTEISGAGTLDLHGYYQTLRQEPISVAGPGFDGNGALINNAAGLTHLYYVTLIDNATLGGTDDWSIQGPTLEGSGWAHGYLNGSDNHYALTKAGANKITLNDLSETKLGDVFVNGGNLTLQGNTTLGNGSPSRVYLANTATLTLSNSIPTVPHLKPITVEATNGTLRNEVVSSTLTSDILLNGTLTAAPVDATTLTLNGNITGLGGLTKSAANATLVLGGLNNDFDGTTKILGGTLQLTGHSTIANVENAFAFQVTAGTHSANIISGAGTMSVLNSATITAVSITQGTLTIGSSSAAAVPEPGTLVLLTLAGLAFVGGYLRRK
jgi:fibronectin-binding autotransporter adhesin